MTGNVDTKLIHDGNRFRPHMPRSSTSTFNFEAISRVVPKQSFSHLAASGISRAENQNALLPGIVSARCDAQGGLSVLFFDDFLNILCAHDSIFPLLADG